MFEEAIQNDRNEKVCPRHPGENESGKRTDRPERHPHLGVFLLRVLDGEKEAQSTEGEGEDRERSEDNQENVVGQGGCDLSWFMLALVRHQYTQTPDARQERASNVSLSEVDR